MIRNALAAVVVLASISIGARQPGAAGPDGVYLCFVEYRANAIARMEATNRLMYDIYTRNGSITVEQAAQEEAATQILRASQPMYRCEGNQFKALDVRSKPGGGFIIGGYTDVDPLEVCPGYVSQQGNPCKQ